MKVLGAFVAVAALASACATQPPRPITWPSGHYGDVLRKETRAVSVYKGFDGVLFAYATDETPEFQRARSEQLADVYHSTPGPLTDKRGGDLTEPYDGHVFFLAVNTNERGANDLERPTSQWAVSLELDGQVLHPTSIVRLGSKPSAIQALYPYYDRFFVPYRVVFPPEVGPGPYTLVIAGPQGEGRMTFPGESGAGK